MVKGVIFDMDGLMFDTERLWDTLWEPACAALGLPLPADMEKFKAGGRGLAGDNLRRHVAEYIPGDPQKVLDKIWQLADERFARGVPCKKGLKEAAGHTGGHGPAAHCGQLEPAEYDRDEFADHRHGAVLPRCCLRYGGRPRRGIARTRHISGRGEKAAP